jgi:hypothetical protein
METEENKAGLDLCITFGVNIQVAKCNITSFFG